ncbi:hypothetical protein DN543_31290, partial [Burkholderia multivorans]
TAFAIPNAELISTCQRSRTTESGNKSGMHANAVGPSLGGVLTQTFGWRSVFYVNLPVGLLSLVFVWRYL